MRLNFLIFQSTVPSNKILIKKNLFDENLIKNPIKIFFGFCLCNGFRLCEK